MARIVEFAVRLPRLRRDDADGQRVPVRDPRAATATPTSRSASGTSRRRTRWRTGRATRRWPLGRGFERFYGFLAGETDQYHPDLVHDNHQIDPPRTPRGGLPPHRGPCRPRDRLHQGPARRVAADRPFFLYFTPGACHAPHQVPSRTAIAATRASSTRAGTRWREEIFARQQQSALPPEGTQLSERPHWIAGVGLAQRRRAPAVRPHDGGVRRVPRAHRRTGRAACVDFLESLGELDNTIVLIMSDNGASAEGGPRGSFNENYFFNMVPESLEENLRRIDDLGGPDAHNHYPVGLGVGRQHAAEALEARDARGRRHRSAHRALARRPRHAGEVRAPVRARDRRDADAARRHRHRRARRDRGRRAAAPRRRQLRATFTDADAPSARDTQYYEMLGCRAIYHDGWKAVVFHPMVGFAYDGSDPRKPFDDDEWELYHVAEDFSETVDLADRGARAAEADDRPVVGGGRAQPGAPAEQPARPARRPPLPAGALRVPPRHRRASSDTSRRTCATAATA